MLSSLSCENGHGKVPKFRVELRNVEEDDMILDLGSIIGKKQNPKNIAMTLFDARGRSLHLVDLPSRWSLPAGSVQCSAPPSRFKILYRTGFGQILAAPGDVRRIRKAIGAGTYWLQAQFSVKGDSQPEREFGCGVRSSRRDIIQIGYDLTFLVNNCTGLV